MPRLRRRAARVAVVDAVDRVLLLRASDPAQPDLPGWWELPGGGIDPGEESADAARRELWEEAGLSAGVTVGPAVWTHHVQFRFAGYHFDQHEWIHVARLDGAGGEIRPAALEGIEVAAFSGARWLPVAELAGLAAGERIIPHWLPERLPAALAGDAPPEPIDLGEQSVPGALP